MTNWREQLETYLNEQEKTQYSYIEISTLIRDEPYVFHFDEFMNEIAELFEDKK